MVGVLAGAWLFARLAGRARDDAALVRGVLLLLAGMCATLPAASIVGSAGWLVPLWMITGLLNGGMNVFAGVVMAIRVPEAVRGRAFATLGASVQAAAIAGYFAGGVLVELLPVRPTVAGLGVVGLVVVAALAAPVLRAIRRERARAPGRSQGGRRGSGPNCGSGPRGATPS